MDEKVIVVIVRLSVERICSEVLASMVLSAIDARLSEMGLYSQFPMVYNICLTLFVRPIGQGKGQKQAVSLELKRYL
jgi:hypothetical protein